MDLVITDVSTTAMPSSPRDTEQISTLQEETIYRNTAADLRRLSGEVIGNASRLTAGTNLSLTEPISIKQEPIEPIPGWTCNSTMYADGSFCIATVEHGIRTVISINLSIEGAPNAAIFF